jgi:hypothetical protein
MKFDFYYGEESEQYSFYSVPKMFFDNDKFKDLSAMSKLLYSFLLDRMSLSKRRNWIDDKNRAYIKYSLKAICNDMCVSRNSVIKYMKELQTFGLIMKFPKEGMEDIIYVMHFSKVKQADYHIQNSSINNTSKSENIATEQQAEAPAQDTQVYDTYAPPDFSVIEHSKKSENSGYVGVHTLMTSPKLAPVQNLNQSKICTSPKSEPVQYLHHPHQELNNNIYNINNKIFNSVSDTDRIDRYIYKSYPSINHNNSADDNTNTADRELIGQAAFSEYDFICGQVKSDINYDEMMTRADCADWYSDYYSLIVEILTRKSDVIRISGEEYSMQLVKKRFSMLTAEHLVYVHNQVSKARGIKNIKAYLIKSLFNAPVTHMSFVESSSNNTDTTKTEAGNNGNVKYAANRFNNFEQREKKTSDWYNKLLNNND